MCYNNIVRIKIPNGATIMKLKKLLPVLALSLAATTLTACGDKTVSLGKYWQLDATAKTEAFYEQATYAISSEATESSYCNYKVEYTGTYVTTLESVTNVDYDYVFKTDLTITAKFTLGTDTVEKTDTATTEVRFVAGENLRPVYSKKTMACHVPLQGEYLNVNECYTLIDYNYEIDYKQTEKGGSIQGQYHVTKNDKVTDVELKDTFSFEDDYTFVDNDLLLVAARAFDASESSAVVSTYGVFTENLQKVKFSLSDADKKAAESFNYTVIAPDGTESAAKKDIVCRTAKISLDQTNPGATQTVKFAKNTDEKTNTYRNVIVEITTPLSFGMGEIYYKLAKVSYNK